MTPPMFPPQSPRVLGANRQVDNSESHTFPPSRGDGRMTLADLFGQALVQSVQTVGSLTFQAAGDTGVGTQNQKDVAFAMSRDLDPNQRENGPLFFLNLGDIIYGARKDEAYTEKFYRPYLEYIQAPVAYDGAILGIPGNHDGETRSSDDKPSLKAFLENFCQLPGHTPPLAKSFGVAMPNQPGAYWWLDAPFLDLIGLYSNAKENDGMLGANATETHQQDWLEQTLGTIRQNRQNGPLKALVIAVHHPPFSRGLSTSGFGHPGSPILLAQIDTASRVTGIWPDTVISGHSHNYQRYMRQINVAGQVNTIPYFVAGTGGIGLQDAPFGIGNQANNQQASTFGFGNETVNVVYANGLKSFGYLSVKADATSVTTTFIRTDDTHRNMFETIQVDLLTGQRTHPIAP